MPKESRWVHGNAIVAETLRLALARVAFDTVNGTPLTNTDIVGLRQGFGITYQGNAPSLIWFHAMIPTPVIVNDKRTRLDKVFVLYRSANQVQLRKIHVWDGPNFIKELIPSGAAHGEHSANPNEDGITSFGIPEHGEEGPEVFFGIGISIQVEFGVEGAPVVELPFIRFTTAGADFFY